jgi:hypothetical protein
MRDALTDCAKASRFERPEMVAIYRCYEETPCTEAVQRCGAMVTPGSLGDELGAKAAACGWTGWTDEQVRAFNGWEGWLRGSAAGALRSCLAQSDCGDAAACIRAFTSEAL